MTSQQSLTQTVSDARTGPTVAVIPAYNEDRFIASVVFKARRHVDQVIVVDDGSTDDTAILAQAAGAHLIGQANLGKAAALNTGLMAARAMNASMVILIDGDGQQNPNDIPSLLQPIRDGKADIVVGSRFMGVASNTPRWRIAGQQALTLATNLASGVALTDSQSGFRALSHHALEQFSFKTQGFSVESEMQFLIKQHNLIACEVPIIVSYDEKPKRNPVSQGFQVLNGILRMIAQNRPLFFFGVPGVLILIVGVLLSFSVVSAYNLYNALAVGHALIALTLVIIGLLTIFTGVILHTIHAYMSEQ